jgi:hypothetical protein
VPHSFPDHLKIQLGYDPPAKPAKDVEVPEQIRAAALRINQPFDSDIVHGRASEVFPHDLPDLLDLGQFSEISALMATHFPYICSLSVVC